MPRDSLTLTTRVPFPAVRAHLNLEKIFYSSSRSHLHSLPCTQLPHVFPSVLLIFNLHAPTCVTQSVCAARSFRIPRKDPNAVSLTGGLRECH